MSKETSKSGTARWRLARAKFERKAAAEPPLTDEQAFEKDWTRKCENCGEQPVVRATGLCGPCTFGEAETVNGNW